MSDTQPQPPEDDDVLAAEYVLGLAEGDALETARDRTRHDAGFASRVAGWQERFVAMTDGIDPVNPPRKLRRALMAQVFPKQRLPLMQRLWVWQGISFAALALAAYLAVPLLRPAPTVATVDVYATQMTSDAFDLTVLAVVDARGDVALRRLSGDIPAGRVLELWAILPEQEPVSLGVLPQTETARIRLPDNIAQNITSVTLAISDEPEGGAPQGTPTGDIRAVGAISEL